MAVSNPTKNFGWVLPVVGGSIGSWGTLLNAVFGEDGAGGGVKGIDQVIQDLSDRVTTAETNITNIENRITVLEGSTAVPLFARTTMSAAQTIPKDVATKVVWGQQSFDQGDLLLPDPTKMTVPVSGDGLYIVRTSLQVDSWQGTLNDNRHWEVEIRKNGAVIARALLPFEFDGFDVNSGDVTVAVATLDNAVAGDFYEVFAKQSTKNSSSSGTVKTSTGSYFEAARVSS